MQSTVIERPLADLVDELIPGARTVRITPVRTDASGRPRIEFAAFAFDGDGQPIKPRPGASRQVADLIRARFPHARWIWSHTWRASDGGLVELVPGIPAWMRESVPPDPRQPNRPGR